jgi:hypothetical protein
VSGNPDGKHFVSVLIDDGKEKPELVQQIKLLALM